MGSRFLKENKPIINKSNTPKPSLPLSPPKIISIQKNIVIPPPKREVIIENKEQLKKEKIKMAKLEQIMIRLDTNGNSTFLSGDKNISNPKFETGALPVLLSEGFVIKEPIIVPGQDKSVFLLLERNTILEGDVKPVS